MFALSMLVVLGGVWAANIDHAAINEARMLTYVAICAAVLFLQMGIVLFLRKALAEERTLPAKIRSFSIHCFVSLLIPVLLVGLLFNFGGYGVKAAGGLEPMMVDEAVMAAEMEFAVMERVTRQTIVTAKPGGDPAEAEPPRIRRFFPETLLWRPQLLTGADGKAQLKIPLADSITTWRLAGSAVGGDGRMGSFQQGIRVFQDFFIDIDFPVALTQNDEITVPIALFNYLDEPQTIQLEAKEADWFELIDDTAEKSVQTAAGGVMSASYRIRALKPGRHSLTVLARGSSLSDAVERTVRVIPDGERVEQVINGRLDGEARESVTIPVNAIEGGSDLYLKIYPGAFSQVVEGMDSIFRMPYGCFEQTSSTTYPNVLVLNYLRETKQAKPELEMKALDFIAQGYQRLLSYEVDGGGFEWFGSPPAHNILTAYGLMEFVDMAEVYDVEPALIERTREWLMNQQEGDGTWKPTRGGIAEGAINNFQQGEEATLRATAYITWAVAQAGGKKGLDKSFDFLAQKADGSEDAYTLALIANAFLAADRKKEGVEVLKQLSKLKTEEDGVVYWKATGSGLTYGRGDAFSIETTALIAQAMMNAPIQIDTAHKALAWLISQRDGGGTWHSTQATVQAMRALLLGAGSVGQVEGEVNVRISANGQETNSLQINEENQDVFHLVSLTELVRDGKNDLVLTSDAKANLAYQIVGVHYAPRTGQGNEPEQILEIETEYSTTELAASDLLTVKVLLRYNRPESAPMTLVDLGIPPGFEIEADSFQKLIANKTIERFEPKGRQVTLYFESIPGGGENLTFEYQLRAKFPVKAQAPASVAYQYYEPEVRDESEPVTLTVAE